MNFINEVSRINFSKNDSFINKNINCLNRVTWFIPAFSNIIQGGIRTIFEFANYLSVKCNSFNIFVVYDANSNFDSSKIYELKKYLPELMFTSIIVRKLDVSNIPRADIGICTFWMTAYLLLNYNQCYRKFYFIQDDEKMFYPAGTMYGLAEATLKFNFLCIANSKGVYEQCVVKYNNKGIYFNPVVSKNIYNCNDSYRKKNNIAKMVIYGRPQNDRNGFELILQICILLKKKFGNKIEIYSVGMDWKEAKYGLDGVVVNLGKLKSLDEVADLYRQMDFGICFMYTPHPSYQPLEYMACGCIPIVNTNMNNYWLLQDGYNAVVIDAIPSVAVDKISDVIFNADKRRELLDNIKKTVENMNNWEEEYEKIYQFIVQK